RPRVDHAQNQHAAEEKPKPAALRARRVGLHGRYSWKETASVNAAPLSRAEAPPPGAKNQAAIIADGGPGLRRVPRGARSSAPPRPSARKRAGAWWRCRSPPRDRVRPRRKIATRR